MKKILLIIWSVLIFGGAVFLIFSNLNTFEAYYYYTRQFEKQRKLLKKEKVAVFSRTDLDSLLIKKEYVLLTVGVAGCSACDLVLLSPVPAMFDAPLYFVDKNFDPKNMLVSQALYSSGSPESYVIDRSLNIEGVVYGNVDFKEVLDEIINRKLRTRSVDIIDMTPDSSLQMITYGFKGLLALFEGNMENVYTYAHKSKLFGNYFFNNYLLYKYYENAGHSDSTKYYRDFTLENIKYGGDIFKYESLVREIDPDNEKLKWIPPAPEKKLTFPNNTKE